MKKFGYLLFVMTFSTLMWSSLVAYGQDIQNDTCVNLNVLPSFQREQDASEIEQLFQQINIERLRSGRPAYGYSTSLSNTAAAIAGALAAIPANQTIPPTSIGDEVTQQILEASGYEPWPDDNVFIVEATRSVHPVGKQNIDDIVETLFGKAANRGSAQENATAMLESSTYREIGLYVINRPATGEKVVVILVGSRPNEFPVVINFGGNTVTEYGSVLSFYDETNRENGIPASQVLGKILTIGLRNPMGDSEVFSSTNWQPYCLWYPSNFERGASIDVEVQYTDRNALQVVTRASDWMPQGQPIAAPPDGVSLSLPPTEEIEITSNPTPATEFLLEAETSCTGPGSIMIRGNASAERTQLVGTLQTLSCSFTAQTGGTFSIEVRYSNDQGSGGAELLTLALNGTELTPVLQAFNTIETGEAHGTGWNRFFVAPFNSEPVIVDLTAGETYDLTIAVSAGDGFGVEIDRIRFVPR